MDLDEEEVQEGEKMANQVRGRVLRSGDQKLISLLQRLPDESYGRLISILGK
jgi:hypothetical protein